MIRRILLAAALAFPAASPANAQQDVTKLSNQEIAIQSTDPTSNLWMLMTEFSTGFTSSDPYHKSNVTALEIQPTLPVSLTRDWRVLNFPDLLISTQGTPRGPQASGIESFSWMAALSPGWEEMGFCWGAGPFVSFPASTNSDLSPSQWQFGGGGALSYRTKDSIAIGFLKSGWATSNATREAGNVQLQYNFQRFFGNGYQAGIGHPRIEYTWNRHGRGSWDVPIGVSAGKVFRIGRMPVKIILEYDFYAINDNQWNPQHLFRLTVLPILQNPQKEPIFDN